MSVGTVTEIPQVYQPGRLEYRLAGELLVWASPYRVNSQDLWTVYLGEKVVETFALPGCISRDGVLMNNVSHDEVRAWVAGLGNMIATQWGKA